VAENTKLELGAVDIPERRKVIKPLDDDDKNVLNDFVCNIIVIKIKKIQDDTRKIVEDEAESKKPEQTSEGIRKSIRERECQQKDMKTMKYT
jgi:hypothetical protein